MENPLWVTEKKVDVSMRWSHGARVENIHEELRGLFRLHERERERESDWSWNWQHLALNDAQETGQNLCTVTTHHTNIYIYIAIGSTHQSTDLQCSNWVSLGTHACIMAMACMAAASIGRQSGRTRDMHDMQRFATNDLALMLLPMSLWSNANR